MASEVPLHEVLHRLATYLELTQPNLTVDNTDFDNRTVERLLILAQQATANHSLGNHRVPTSQNIVGRTGPTSPILSLNRDAFIYILTFLSPSWVTRLSFVCSSIYREVRRNESLWKNLCSLVFPRYYKTALLGEKPTVGEGQAVWRQVFKERHQQDIPWFTNENPRCRQITGQRGVHSILFDRNTLLSGSGQHHEIISIDLRTGLRHNGPSGAGLFGHQQAVTCMKMLPQNPNHLVTSSLDTTLRLFSRERMVQTKVYQGHTDKVWCFDVHENRIFSGGSDRTIRVWDVEGANEVTAPLAGHRTSISALRVLTEAPALTLMTGSSGTTIRAWDLGNGGPQCILKLRGHLKGVFCLQPACGLLLSGSLDNVIKAWDPRQGFRHVFDLIEYDNAAHPIISPTHEQENNVGIISFSCDDTKVVSGGPDKKLKLWDLRTRRLVRTFEGHSHWVTSVQIDSDKIVSGSRDKSVRLWDINGRIDESVHPSIGSPVA